MRRHMSVALNQNLNQLSQLQPDLKLNKGYREVDDNLLQSNLLSLTAKEHYRVIFKSSEWSGIFIASDHYLLNKYFWMSKDSIKRSTRLLEKHYYIYRGRIGRAYGGSKRSYTTKDNFDKYVYRCINKRKFEEAYHVLEFFEAGYHLYPSEFNPNTLEIISHLKRLVKMQEAHYQEALNKKHAKPEGAKNAPREGAKNAPSDIIINNNINNKHNNRIETAVVAFSNKSEKFHGYNFFLKTLTKQEMNLVEKYTQYFLEDLRNNAYNPVGYLRTGLRQGWLESKIREYEDNQFYLKKLQEAENQLKEEIKKNQALAYEYTPIFNKMRPVDEKGRELTLSVESEHAVHISFYYPNGEKTARILAYNLPQFEEEFKKYIDLLKEKMQKQN